MSFVIFIFSSITLFEFWLGIVDICFISVSIFIAFIVVFEIKNGNVEYISFFSTNSSLSIDSILFMKLK